MMRFHWPISNLTFFWSAENEYNQFSSVIFAHAIIQENWKIELAEPCTDPKDHEYERDVYVNCVEDFNLISRLHYFISHK